MRRPKGEGVDASNRDWIGYEQVEKDQHYRLAEREGQEQFDEDYRVAVCDLGRFLYGDARDRRAFADELGGSLRDIGFAILEGHGLDLPLVERAEREVEHLFRDHPLEQKLRYRARRHGSVNQGYFPIEETSDMHPDLVEGWVFCRRAFAFGHPGPGRYRVEDFWPDSASEPVFADYVRAQERLILPVAQSMLMHLGRDPHLFDARLTATNVGLRLNWYPPLDEAMLASGKGRLLGHEDVDLFTLLPAPSVEGLQVLNRANRKWIRLQAPRGTIVLNTGDYMQRLTNDVLPSTTHRVSPPRDPEQRRRPRVSVPLNVYLWENETLEVLPGLGEPKYPPVRAERFHTAITSKYYGDAYGTGD